MGDRGTFMAEDTNWPPALTPHEEIIFVGSIPLGASEDEMYDLVLAEKRRRLNRQARPAANSLDTDFARAGVSSLSCESLQNS
jgi:hypothetical protein